MNAAKNLYTDETIRRKQLLKKLQQNKDYTNPEDRLEWLILSADAFIIRRKLTEKKSIIAGYHGFKDWGRNMRIFLPDLTRVTGRFRDAKGIFLTFKQYCKDEFIPNRIPTLAGDNSFYNAVDATR